MEKEKKKVGVLAIVAIVVVTIIAGMFLIAEFGKTMNSYDNFANSSQR